MIKSIKDYPISGKKILMRVDFNVPLKNGIISDSSRIELSLPSINYILSKNCSLVLMSHLGRPKGFDKKLSLLPCAKKLSDLLKREVFMASDCIGEEVEKKVNSLKSGEILLLENLRFHEGEENPEKDPSFAKKLASLGEIYVNEAFSACHRKHSSIYQIVQYFPQKALMGFLLEKEISILDKYLKNPKRPFFAIIGGAKVSTKIKVLLKLLEQVDSLFIGGAMSFTFLKAIGRKVGSSILEEDQIDSVKKALSIASNKKIEINIPLDIVIADKFENNANSKIISSSQDILPPWRGMDIGPQTIDSWREKIKLAKTIFWNGPMGVFEMDNFSNGTNEIAKAIASTEAFTIAGGGDSLAAINRLKLKEKFSHLSTGGGASLEFIEYGTLPGIEVLK
ncbi:MAG: phosphoglycerate kinase [Chlamydiae bacterium SM23_39]|nr:MAG: phosphoglycerate kinase [Chlamydiae bacterium SM23_39]